VGDGGDYEAVATDAIKDGIRSAADDELADAGLRSDSAEIGMNSQCLGDRNDASGQALGGVRLVHGYEGPNFLKASEGQRRPDDLERATFFGHVFGWGAISAPRTWPRRLVGVDFTADTFRRRQLAIRAPGKQPGFHVFVPDEVAGLHLAVGLAHFREHALLVCDVGFDGIGNQEIGAPARGFGQFCEPALGGGLEAYAKSRASCVRHEHRITREGRISKSRNGHERRGAETRFHKLVADRKQLEDLATKLPVYIPAVESGWQMLGCILADDCRIHSERFFRGGHNALLPFVMFLSKHVQPSGEDRRGIIQGIYLAIMSGVFSGAEARMGAFARNKVAASKQFPLHELIALVKREYGIKSLDDLLRRHLDLALNIAHGGITLDRNPEDLQRDHVFPKSQLEKQGYPYEVVNHYANFHFLRGVDNLNKLDKPPDDWFKNPGRDVSPYSDRDLDERLLTWDDLQPGHFKSMIDKRGQEAVQLFGIEEAEFDALLADNQPQR